MTTPPPTGNDSDDPDPAAPQAPVWPTGQLPSQPSGLASGSGPARARRLAIAAVVTGLCGLAVLAIAFAVGIGPFSGVDEESALSRPDGSVPVSTLKIGECFTAKIHDAADPFVSRSPCDHPHNGEVVGTTTLPDARYPGYQKLTEQAAKACEGRIPAKVKDVGELESRPDVPGEKEWKDGKRGVTCTLVVISNRSLTTPIAALNVSPLPGEELKQGDCLERWHEEGTQPVVDCAKKHEYQVLAVYEMRGKEYPGQKALVTRSAEDCAERAVKIWRADPPLHLISPTAAFPTKDGWETGDRRVVCLITGKKGPLTRSVVPR
ncbi:septum formation family protein [Spirillospora sp. NBC_00431]